MAGSNGSGEDMEAGRTNQATDTTRVWARRTDSDDGDDFNWEAIFVAEVAKTVDDPEEFLDGDWRPQHAVDGIVGSGWSGAHDTGGVGVVGNGGTNQGTGVVGHGGREGSGGTGVHGIGGSVSGFPNDPSPGAGIVAQGGRMPDHFNDKRLPHGAGVIAIAGGSRKPIPSFADTGSIGIFAQGAEAEIHTVSIENVPTVVGPAAPGAGVLGRGGVPIPPGDPVAAGVIGLAGGVPIPSIAATGNTGVFGEGSVGVKGKTDAGIAVFGIASDEDGRAGAFESKRSAQVWIVPHSQPNEFPEPFPATPYAISGDAVNLPGDACGGDLMSITDPTGQCTLWFCVRGANENNRAVWAQVLLGPLAQGNS